MVRKIARRIYSLALFLGGALAGILIIGFVAYWWLMPVVGDLNALIAHQEDFDSQAGIKSRFAPPPDTVEHLCGDCAPVVP